MSNPEPEKSQEDWERELAEARWKDFKASSVYGILRVYGAAYLALEQQAQAKQQTELETIIAEEDPS